MKNRILAQSFVVLGSLITTSAAFAAGDTPVCATVAACRALQPRIAEQLRALALKELPPLSDVARNSWGQVRRLSYAEAEEYCDGIGGRLPSAREFEVLAQSQGAYGLIEARYRTRPSSDPAVRSDMFAWGRKGFLPIYTWNDMDQESVDFYGSSQGYATSDWDERFLKEEWEPWLELSPAISTRRAALWSSSSSPACESCVYAYSPEYGNLDYEHGKWNRTTTARCVVARSKATGEDPTKADVNAVCDTIQGCQSLRFAVESRIDALLVAAAPRLTDFVRLDDPAGRIWTGVSYREADRACRKAGLRLPTAREVAHWASLHGARGVVESLYRGIPTRHSQVFNEIQAHRAENHDVIYSMNATGEQVVDFYVDWSGYRAPDRYFFAAPSMWTSSLYDKDSAYIGPTGFSGGMAPWKLKGGNNYETAVRCVY